MIYLPYMICNNSIGEYADLRQWGVTTPAAQDIYAVITRLARSYGRRLEFDNIRANTTRPNRSIRTALKALARAGLITIDHDSDEVLLIY